MNTQELINLAETYGAHNYKPLPVVIERAEGVWVFDPESKKYMDMLSAYSAVNQGHCHKKIINTLIEQAKKVTLTSRAFYNAKLGPFLKKVCDLTGMEMVLPMNTGAEAVETAIKTARKWGYKVKKVEENKAEIIVCNDNFHGRTTTIISFSSEPQYKDGFGPFTPGFKLIPYNNIEALEQAITHNTVAFLFEPIQGEAGVVVPHKGYIKKVREICTTHNILMIADEIQTGLGRTGKLFACDHENVKPDMYVIGKALSGGFMPVSCVASKKEILGVFNPGDHGSTFGGNPLGCAIAMAALDILFEENLIENARVQGKYFMEKLKTLSTPYIEEIRGKGLLIGVKLKKEAGGARKYCEMLMNEGLLCKETHEHVIRFAPPLTVTRQELDWAFDKIKKVLEN